MANTSGAQGSSTLGNCGPQQGPARSHNNLLPLPVALLSPPSGMPAVTICLWCAPPPLRAVLPNSPTFFLLSLSPLSSLPFSLSLSLLFFSFYTYLVSTYSMLGHVLGAGKTEMNQTQTLPSRKPLLARDIKELMIRYPTKCQAQMTKDAQEALRTTEVEGTSSAQGVNPGRLPRRGSIPAALPKRQHNMVRGILDQVKRLGVWPWFW